ncbi:MAG TPA: hypothetical protein VMV58_04700 [Desulfosporosinus sp.]|nr:hypothetical protein [Desulfosporosinus sp.]
MIASIGSNSMLSKMTSLNHNAMARTGMGEEAKESMSERMAEAKPQPSSAKAAKTQNPTNLGNKIDRLV